jgi:hypothetical protein
MQPPHPRNLFPAAGHFMHLSQTVSAPHSSPSFSGKVAALVLAAPPSLRRACSIPRRVSIAHLSSFRARSSSRALVSFVRLFPL